VNLTQVVQTLALDVPGRLSRYLFQRSLAVGEATTEGLMVSLGMSKTDLAASLGTVPETLSRALGKLRDEGVLEVRGSEIIVYDVGALARLGSGWEG
jgi:CRP/FNR family transcriptional regulator